MQSLLLRIPRVWDRGLAGAIGVALSLGALAACGGLGGEKNPGVVVEEMPSVSRLEAVGVQPGDVLLSWQRKAAPPTYSRSARGQLRDPFDWDWVRLEQGPRGEIVLEGLREGEPITFEVGSGYLRVTLRPALPPDLEEIYQEATRLLDLGEHQGASDQLLRLAQEAALRPEVLETVPAWAHLRRARLWRSANSDEQSLEAFAAMKEAITGPRAERMYYRFLATHQASRGRFTEAIAATSAVARVARKAWGPDSLTASEGIALQGWYLGRAGEPAEAIEQLQEELPRIRRLAPGSILLSNTLNSLGSAFDDLGRYGEAQEALAEAVELLIPLAPGSKPLASALGNLGALAFGRGDYPAAAAAFEQALEIKRVRGEPTWDLAPEVSNLAKVHLVKGDLEVAERGLLEALEFKKEACADCPTTLFGVAALAQLYLKRSDLEAAAALLAPYLTDDMLESSSNPEASLELLRQAGIAEFDRSDLRQAEKYCALSLRIARAHLPGGKWEVDALGRSGEVARLLGKTSAAEEHFSRLLQLLEQSGSLGLRPDGQLLRLSDFYQAKGDLESAEKYLSLALGAASRVIPGTAEEAAAAFRLGELHRQAERPLQARPFFQQGLEALEIQARRLGGGRSSQEKLRSRFLEPIRSYIGLLFELGEEEEAFRVLEQARANSLREMLAERDLDLLADLPADLVVAWQEARLRYSEALDFLSRSESEEDIEQRSQALEVPRREFDRADSSLRRASPRLAALQYPEALGFADARQALDQGTALLSYSLGESESLVFLVLPGEALKVVRLQTSAQAIRQGVDAFREELSSPRQSRARGRLLFDQLLAPVEELVADSKRLLVVPDGPLHQLPWSALVRSRPDEQTEFLVQWKPVTTVVSASLWAELKASREPQNGRSHLVAYGDPVYSPGREAEGVSSNEEVRLRAALGARAKLDSLPGTRREVAHLAAFYEPRASVFLGASATEESVKARSSEAQILHFAVHGLLDEQSPLNSGLFLTIPESLEEGQENGLLQAWEVFEDLRLDADLVVLSACESGLGKEEGGEGLIGLTRAFQYAGARTIAATLWQVPDQTMAPLMVSFHRQLRQGLPADEALRRAQIEFLKKRVTVVDEEGRSREVDASAPYYWAGVQLYGDGR